MNSDAIFTGKVVEGKKQGRKLGFPTANILVDANSLSKFKPGIYAGKAYFEGEIFKASLYFQVPTVISNKIVLEAYIHNFNRNIYHKEIRLELLHFLRKSEFFKGEKELISQIKADISKTEEVIKL